MSRCKCFPISEKAIATWPERNFQIDAGQRVSNTGRPGKCGTGDNLTLSFVRYQTSEYE